MLFFGNILDVAVLRMCVFMSYYIVIIYNAHTVFATDITFDLTSQFAMIHFLSAHFQSLTALKIVEYLNVVESEVTDW